jgi:hypothetical protein
MDIIWHNEKGIPYFGPHAEMLQNHNAFVLLEEIEGGGNDNNPNQ